MLFWSTYNGMEALVYDCSRYRKNRLLITLTVLVKTYQTETGMQWSVKTTPIPYSSLKRKPQKALQNENY